MKLSKQLVNAPIIFITSIIPGSPFRPLDGSTTQVLLSFLGPLDLWSLAFLNALSLWSPQWWHTWFVLGLLCDHGRDFALVLDLTTVWFRGLFNTRWLATFFFFSTFAFSTVGATTIGSLAFTNFTSLEIFTAELISPMCPSPVLLKKDFWWKRTSSNFFMDACSILEFYLWVGFSWFSIQCLYFTFGLLIVH